MEILESKSGGNVSNNCCTRTFPQIISNRAREIRGKMLQLSNSVVVEHENNRCSRETLKELDLRPQRAPIAFSIQRPVAAKSRRLEPEMRTVRSMQTRIIIIASIIFLKQYMYVYVSTGSAPEKI
jgi:hypothetical protein